MLGSISFSVAGLQLNAHAIIFVLSGISVYNLKKLSLNNPLDKRDKSDITSHI